MTSSSEWLTIEDTANVCAEVRFARKDYGTRPSQNDWDALKSLMGRITLTSEERSAFVVAFRDAARALHK